MDIFEGESVALKQEGRGVLSRNRYLYAEENLLGSGPVSADFEVMRNDGIHISLCAVVSVNCVKAFVQNLVDMSTNSWYDGFEVIKMNLKYTEDDYFAGQKEPDVHRSSF